MSNVEQQSIVFSLNQKFHDGTKLALKDFDTITDVSIFNKFAKQGLLDDFLSLVNNAAPDTPNLDHYKKLASERGEYKKGFAGVVADSGARNNTWLRS
jgi:hypothetical protein